MTEITREQFVERFGHIQVQFSSYYKFEFTFCGVGRDSETGEEVAVLVSLGGSSDAIYRQDITADEVLRVEHGDWFKGSANVPSEGEVEFYDY